MTTNAEALRSQFAAGLDAAARVRARRPNLFQVELPAYMGDGDVAAIYVRPRGRDKLVVTDLGSTRMRLSYGGKTSGDLEEELSRLAAGQGFAIEEGEIVAEVHATDVLAAALGLLQVEAQAEQLPARTRRRTKLTAQFREQVLELLHDTFGAKVRSPYFDAQHDPDALYQVDALIEGKKPLAVAFVPTDVDAERAVGAKLKLEPYAPRKTRWIAIPRDLERLTSKTRQRLVREYIPAGSTFEEDRDVVRDRLRDLADVA